MLKALKWAYGDSLRYIGFLIAAYLVVAAFLVFLFYPLQTVVAVVGFFVLWYLLMLFSEWR